MVSRRAISGSPASSTDSERVCWLVLLDCQSCNEICEDDWETWIPRDVSGVICDDDWRVREGWMRGLEVCSVVSVEADDRTTAVDPIGPGSESPSKPGKESRKYALGKGSIMGSACPSFMTIK